MTNTPAAEPKKPVSPDSFHRFFVSYDAVLSPSRTISGFRTFSGTKELMNYHDINFICRMVAEHLAKTYHTPVSDGSISLKSIIYLGYQDVETWTHNSYEDADENPE